MECEKTTNEKKEGYRFSKSGCLFACLGFVIVIILLLWGRGFFHRIPQWFANVIDPAPEGREALIWRYFKGLETGEYEHWEKGCDSEGNSDRYRGVLWDMDESWDKDRFRDSYRYYKRKYGDNLKITYEIDDVEPMDDEQLMRLSDYLMERYGDRIDYYGMLVNEYKNSGAYEYDLVVTEKAWIYELYIEIEGEDDDSSHKSNYVVYEIEGRLYLEPMDFE